MQELIRNITELLEETHTDLDACRYLDTHGDHTDSENENDRYQGQEVAFKDKLEGYEGGQKDVRRVASDLHSSNKQKERRPGESELITVNSDDSIGLENNPIKNMNLTTAGKPKSPKGAKNLLDKELVSDIKMKMRASIHKNVESYKMRISRDVN